MGSYLAVMLIASVVTALAVPPLRALSRRADAMAHPSDRSVHAEPTPLLGGTALLIGVLAGLGSAWFFGDLSGVFATPGNVIGVIAAAVVMWLIGLVDDLRDISPPAKVAGMVLSGSLLTLVGLTIIYFRVPFLGFTVLPPDLSSLVTVVWVVGMANVVNLIDGLDGLAAGIVAIAPGAFFLYGWALLDEGSSIPPTWDRWSRSSPPARASGSFRSPFQPGQHLHGGQRSAHARGTLASSTIAVGGQSDDPFSGQAWFFFAPLILPLVILAVPLIDTVFAILRRATKRQGVATADKAHLHHRLMDLGHGHRRAVFIMWAWTAVLSGFVLIPVYTGRGDAIVPIGLAALALLLFTLFAPTIIRRATARS
ncbi:MAG: MraY family glycosyltransferase [Microthrixaceae bacterium]